MDCDTIEERCKLYAAIERADKQLVDAHELKVALARQLVEQCLLIHRGMLGKDFFLFLILFSFSIIFFFNFKKNLSIFLKQKSYKIYKIFKNAYIFFCLI